MNAVNSNTTPRLVVAGTFTRQSCRLDVAPDFGTSDEWLAAMESVVDAAPEYRPLDEDWVTVISEEITANPAGIAFAIEPRLLGRFDAEMGLPCEPFERGYRTVVDCEAYIVGWKEANAILVEAAEDYESDMLDREWWARGCW